MNKITAEEAKQIALEAATPLEKVYAQIKINAQVGMRQSNFVALSRETVLTLIEDGFSVSFERMPYSPQKDWIVSWQ